MTRVADGPVVNDEVMLIRSPMVISSDLHSTPTQQLTSLSPLLL
jgi:hypothetical protein